jgi:hypothetical protein
MIPTRPAHCNDQWKARAEKATAGRMAAEIDLYSPGTRWDDSVTKMAKKTASGSPWASLQTLVEQFVRQIIATVEHATTQRVQTAISAALGNGAVLFPRKRGRPPKNPLLGGPLLLAPVRRRPKQLCPVPGCSNPAAPVFGMVCAKHKDLPKAQIKKYREARREAKAKA